jgi:hypothetical protein
MLPYCTISVTKPDFVTCYVGVGVGDVAPAPPSHELTKPMQTRIMNAKIVQRTHFLLRASQSAKGNSNRLAADIRIASVKI